MWTLLLVVFATGSPAVLQAAPVQGDSGKCSFAGVSHLEGIRRYSLTFQKAGELCQRLGYKLATQEQVTEAYKKGLRTCRYGWIDGQNVMFLPHVNGPNCDSSSTEFTFHAEAAEYLSDVYCFNLSDSSPNCEDDVKSEDFMNGNIAIENGKPHEDILTDFKTEGFLVDLEEILGRVKRETSPLDDTKLSIVPSTSTHIEDTKEPTSKPHIGKTPNVLFFDTEGSGSGGTRMISAIATESNSIHNNNDEDLQMAVTYPNVNSNSIQNNIDEDIQVAVAHPNVNAGLDVVADENTKKSRFGNSPTPEQTEGSPPAWMIITAFCVFVGAIVCILVAIGTRDKWYGPRKSSDITTENNNKDYSKAGTLPLSDKEQEIVALMNVENMKNGKTDVNTGLDESEKEYLM